MINTILFLTALSLALKCLFWLIVIVAVVIALYFFAAVMLGTRTEPKPPVEDRPRYRSTVKPFGKCHMCFGQLLENEPGWISCPTCAPWNFPTSINLNRNTLSTSRMGKSAGGGIL